MKTSVHHLDIRGAIVPITLLKVTGAFREIKPGEILEILGSDPDTRKELFQVLNAFHYQLMDVKDGKTSYRIRLKKVRVKG
ncbi:sulfurtransferase TusA family protein [Desulfobacterales bacterium HSG2]|nr:sulfurtransferase TusA family protein [Desulfobacterales bacterium HSG2]